MIIKDINRLGADTGLGKPPPILIRFGHPTERNSILPLSRNIKKDAGISIDKSIPKLYQKKHRDFKRLAWKLATIHNVKTQVIFEGCNLVLRYKQKDDGLMQYNYITEKEWMPQPSDLSLISSVSYKDPSKHDTSALDVSRHSSTHRTLIVTGVPDTVNNVNARCYQKKMLLW